MACEGQIQRMKVHTGVLLILCFCNLTMGYLGCICVESKSYEIRSEIGNGGVRLDWRSRGIFRAVVLGKLSVIWLIHTMEALIKGDELRYFCRTLRSGNTAYVAETRTITKGIWSF